jgi:PAS domain S-box-containing protein
MSKPPSQTIGISAEEILQNCDSQDKASLLRGLLAFSGQAVVVHRDHLILFANQAYANMMDVNLDDILHKTWLNTTVEAREARVEEFSRIWGRDLIKNHDEGIFEALNRRTDGSTFWATVNAINISWQGEPARLNTFTDLTPRIEMETRLKSTQQELEKANQAKSEFLAHMSHELRTPLNAIIGFSELMTSGAAGELAGKQAEYLMDINQSGQHLLSLINDVLDISKIEAGKLELVEDVFNLGDELRRGLLFIREQARKAGLRIIEGDLNDCPDILGDRRIVLQMIVNLLTNAIKYNTENGEVQLEGGADEKGQPWFSITDTGVGIAADDIEAVLSPYGRTNIDEATEGTGLGLPLVVRMAELHEAEISLNSEPGKGTTAKVTFPASRLAVGVYPDQLQG